MEKEFEATLDLRPHFQTSSSVPWGIDPDLYLHLISLWEKICFQDFHERCVSLEGLVRS